MIQNFEIDFLKDLDILIFNSDSNLDISINTQLILN